MPIRPGLPNSRDRPTAIRTNWKRQSGCRAARRSEAMPVGDLCLLGVTKSRPNSRPSSPESWTQTRSLGEDLKGKKASEIGGPPCSTQIWQAHGCKAAVSFPRVGWDIPVNAVILDLSHLRPAREWDLGCCISVSQLAPLSLLLRHVLDPQP